MSRLQSMQPTTAKQYEDFADTLGEHCQSFHTNLYYKTFVQELIEKLCDDLPPAKLLDITNHIHRFAQTRAKEEKAGDVQYHLRQPVDDAQDNSSDDDTQTGLYDDFM